MNRSTEQLTEQQPSAPTPDATPSVSLPTDDELDTLRSENAELKDQLRVRAARDDFTKLLASENARSPELLFQVAQQHLAFDDHGAATNIVDLLTDLKDRFPEQFVVETAQTVSAVPDQGQTRMFLRVPSLNSGAGRAPSKPQLTKNMLADMKPQDIARLDWDEVRQVLEQ